MAGSLNPWCFGFVTEADQQSTDDHRQLCTVISVQREGVVAGVPSHTPQHPAPVSAQPRPQE